MYHEKIKIIELNKPGFALFCTKKNQRIDTEYFKETISETDYLKENISKTEYLMEIIADQTSWNNW